MSYALPQRRSLRLRDYDYSLAGAYFVTMCTYQRASFLGWIVDGEVWLGSRGEAVMACWEAIAEHYPQVEVDAFVVMPNHVHGIIVIGDAGEGEVSRWGATGGTCPAPTTAAPDQPDDGDQGADRGAGERSAQGTAGGTCPAPTEGQKGRLARPALGHVVASFKAASTRAIRELDVPTPKVIWQRGYHEHVIRGEMALAHIRQYIADNPAKWEFDHDNPANWR